MAAVCPNCQGLLTTRPTRKKKCPHCGRYIYVRQGQLVGEDQPVFETKITYITPPATKSSPPPKSKSNPLAAILIGALVVLSLCCGILLIPGRSNENNASVNSIAAQPPITRMAATQVVKLAPTAKPTNTPTSTRPPTPNPTRTGEIISSATFTPQVPLTPFVLAEKDVNLRAGPGTAYAVIGGLSAGQNLNIVGRNADSSWWQIETEAGLAWVAASVVKAVNTDREIDLVEAPPPPTPAVAPTVVAPTNTPAPLPTLTPAPFSPAPAPVAPSGGCCKICGPNSQACGDSCISNGKTCHKGSGCACEG